MALTYAPRLRKSILKARAWPVQQFGQAEDYYTFGGATGCTHTVLQRLIYLWKGKRVTHDAISKVAGYPLPGRNAGRRGLYPYEVERVVKHYGLPYLVKLNLSAAEVIEATKKGPVGFGHVYGWWPEWKGYRYGTIRADGNPNGYATPSGKSGRTQLSGFERGAHFGMILGVADGTGGQADLVYAHEPNHGSPARPEKPPYDRMTKAQFTRVYDSYSKVLGRAPYALIPTKSLPSEGY